MNPDVTRVDLIHCFQSNLIAGPSSDRALGHAPTGVLSQRGRLDTTASGCRLKVVAAFLNEKLPHLERSGEFAAADKALVEHVFEHL